MSTPPDPSPPVNPPVPPVDQAPHTDPGLQPERTALSWGRTLLALTITAMLFIRWLPTAGPITLAPLGLCLIAAAAIQASQRRRYTRAAAGINDERLPPNPGAVFGLAGLVVAIAIAGLAVVLVG